MAKAPAKKKLSKAQTEALDHDGNGAAGGSKPKAVKAASAPEPKSDEQIAHEHIQLRRSVFGF